MDIYYLCEQELFLSLSIELNKSRVFVLFLTEARKARLDFCTLHLIVSVEGVFIHEHLIE